MASKDDAVKKLAVDLFQIGVYLMRAVFSGQEKTEIRSFGRSIS
jgi:hypothetical protein